MKIPFARVPMAGNEMKYLKEVLESGWLTTASKAMALEKKFSEYVESPFACAVNSGTSALHLGLEALGVGKGDKVFVPSMTFTASAEIIRYLQADPVFLDTEYGSNLITPEILETAIKKYPEVRYLVVVHYGGQAAKMFSDDAENITEICRKHNIRILEDAAHAFPTKIHNKMVGSYSDAACFSFYANKTITTGEGGMLTTVREDIYNRVKQMRLHGIDRDIWNRYTENKPSWEYDVKAPGFKYNMPDINAALGLAQIEKAKVFRDERQQVAEYYFDHLEDLMEVVDLPLIHVPFEDHSWHLFQVVLRKDAPIGRNEFIEKMAEAGIGTSVHYKPLHRMTYYKERYKLKEGDFPNAEKTWKGNVSLPIFPFMKEEELDYVCRTIELIMRS
ncbi:MAG: DegT/DnrJ/EryC1/StrS family aminotransferase [Bacteroidales bacterium]|nr:DegT/DnrJ/EryC1/StrS family aminotransferase [Bacteroidales bacterium]